MIIQMLLKFMKITPNLERAENTKSAEKQKQKKFSKGIGRKYGPV